MSKKKKKKRYFYYNYYGSRIPVKNRFSFFIVSEVVFPKPKKGHCVFSILSDNNIKINSVVDLAFGDPRFLYRCRLISKYADDCPVEVRYSRSETWKFRYKKKYFWANVLANIEVTKVYKK